MDPLSITASAITLIAAANTITTSLYGFLKAHRNVDSRITSLCDELASLERFLEAVDRTLKGCRSPDLALVDDDLWRQSEFALVDCQVTLTDLAALVERIKEKARAKGFAWRTRAVVDLSIHGSELSTFRDKIHKSNWALQTMLHTITVSLSLRNSASQEMVLLELDRLKSSIDEALRAAVRPASGFIHDLNDRSDARVARNLRNLAEAAKHFHSAASSTASTIRDGSIAQWNGHSGYALSLAGDLPPFRRERVEKFIHGGLSQSPGEQTPLYSSSMARPNDSIPRPLSLVCALERAQVSEPNAKSSRDKEEEEEEDDDEEEYERLFLDGLEELAKDNIKAQNFPKAVEFLKEAMKREVGSSTSNTEFQHLQIQLALCYFLLNEWEQAEPIISSLAKSKPRQDLIISDLLHALSLAYLSKYSFDKALTACKEAAQMKRRMLKKGIIKPADYGETLGLMSTILDMTGDYIRAEVFQRQLPEGFIYKHPAREIDFIICHTDLLQTVFGEYIPVFTPTVASLPGCYEMDAGSDGPAPPSSQEGSVSPLKIKFDQYQRYENDTAKEVVFATPNPAIYIDADEQAIISSSTNRTSSLKRRLTRVFGTRGLRQNNQIPTYSQDCLSSPESPTSPDPPASPDSPQDTVSPMKQWFKSSNLLNKTKTLRRRKKHGFVASGILNQGKKSKTFKLVRMERIVVDKWPDTVHPDTGKEGSISDYFPPMHDNAPSTNSGAAGLLYNGPNRSSQSDLSNTDTGGAKQSLVVTNQDVRFAGTSNITETHSEQVMESSQDMGSGPSNNRDDKHHSNALELEAINPRNRQRSDVDTRPTSTVNRGERSSPNFSKPITVVHNRHAARAKSLKITPCNSSMSSSEIREETTQMSNGGGTTTQHNPVQGIIRRLPHNKDRPPIPAAIAYHPPSPPPEELQRSLAHLTHIFASIPRLQDAEKRCAAKLELEILSQNIESLSNDTLLRTDIQRVIRMLGESENRVPDDASSDSGYESMDGGETCPVKDVLSHSGGDGDGVYSPGLKKVIPPPTTKVLDFSSRNESVGPHVPVLRRTFSWEEDRLSRRPGPKPK